MAAALDAVSVNVVDPPAVTLVGLKTPVTPAGRSDTDSDTVCAVPLDTAVMTVTDVLDPAVTALLAGLRPSEKSLAAGGPAVAEASGPKALLQPPTTACTWYA